MPKVVELLETITARFERVGVPSPRVDAEWLLEHTLGWSRTRLRLEQDRELERGTLERIEALVRRREAREPLQWILGSVEFYGLELRVKPGVLIPRPETERLVELVLERLRALPGSPRVVDIGTGTGAIALAIRHECPRALVTATDINPAAVQLALENAARLGLEVDVRSGSMLADLEPPFEVIVSNPPYLPVRDADSLEPEVQLEPAEALFSGADGLEVAREVISTARAALVPGGLLALELDPRNVHTLAHELLAAGWDRVRVEADLAGRERFVLVVRAPTRGAPTGTTRYTREVTHVLPAVALDVGEARIGFAACDEKGRFVFGRGYHTRASRGQGGLEADVNAIRALFEREQAGVIVVGLPLRTDGTDSPQTARVRAFAQALEAAGLPVVLQDERFTTRIATQSLIGSSKRKRQEKGNTDEASAVAILETWLRKHAAGR